MRTVILTLALAGLVSTTPRAAGDVSVLASGSTEGALRRLAPTLPGGARVTYQFETSQAIARRLAARNVSDVLIAQAAMIDQAIKDGLAIADTRAAIGRIGIGVAVPDGGAAPNVATADALKAAITAADLVVVSQGASGAYVEKAFADLGVADRIAGKLAREPRGDDVMKRLAASGGRAIGFTMISEIKYGERHGARYVGPLPPPLQTYTAYDVVVTSAARDRGAARAYVQALRQKAARATFLSFGWEMPQGSGSPRDD